MRRGLSTIRNSYGKVDATRSRRSSTENPCGGSQRQAVRKRSSHDGPAVGRLPTRGTERLRVSDTHHSIWQRRRSRDGQGCRGNGECQSIRGASSGVSHGDTGSSRGSDVAGRDSRCQLGSVDKCRCAIRSIPSHCRVGNEVRSINRQSEGRTPSRQCAGIQAAQHRPSGSDSQTEGLGCSLRSGLTSVRSLNGKIETT